MKETSEPRVDSNSVGDPDSYLGTEDLEARLEALGEASRDIGHVALLVRRGQGGIRETPAKAHLSGAGGLEGDAWKRGEAQLTVMESPVARMISNGQPLTLFGDQLFVEFDLSTVNLPTGSRIRMGNATLEVTPKAHNGCQKFRARFGTDALRFVSRADLRYRNFRGVYMRVIADGEVAVGDEVRVIRRGTEPD